MVTCWGSRYPAWINQARVFETLVGETGKARLSGSRACCMRSRMAGFAWALGRCQPISRRRDPSTEEGATVAAPKANTITAIVRNTKMESASAMNQTLFIRPCSSNLDPDNFANDKVAHRLQRDATDDQGVSYRVGEKRADEPRVEDEHGDHNGGRQRHEQNHC